LTYQSRGLVETWNPLVISNWANYV